MKELIKTVLKNFISEQQQKWTKNMLSDEASKYNSRVEFRNGSTNAYRAALRIDKKEPGFFDDITKHMNILWQKKWDWERIFNEAKKFKTKLEFKKNAINAYNAAYDHGYMEKLTNMLNWPTPNSWTKENVEQVAKQYTTKVDFQKNEPSAYQMAWRNKWIDDVTKHMIPVGNLVKRMIYAWEFPNKTVYVGLTGNIKNRSWAHLNQPKSPVFRYMESTGLKPKMVEITNKYIDVADAQAEEENTKLKYIENGWEVLNKAKTGALGGSIVKWTPEEIENESKKYTTRVDFIKNSPGAYNAAKKMGIYDKISSHMDWIGGIQWTYDMLKKEAEKYKTRSEFVKGNKNAYGAARKKGILDDITKHMVWKGGEQWSWDKIKELANEYDDYSEFSKDYKGAAAWVRQHKLSDELKKILKYKWENKWDYESVKKEAKKYKSRSEFTQKSAGAAAAAKNKGWWDDVTKHMDILRTNWTKDIIMDLVKNYKTIGQFRKENPNAYSWAHRENLLPLISQNLIKSTITWTPQMIDDELKKYKSYSEFKKGSRKAYDILRYRKNLEYAKEYYDRIK